MDPTLHMTLVSDRCDEVVAGAHRAHDRLRAHASSQIDDVIREAVYRGYQAGLVDGFAQGVAAEEQRSRDEV